MSQNMVLTTLLYTSTCAPTVSMLAQAIYAQDASKSTATSSGSWCSAPAVVGRGCKVAEPACQARVGAGSRQRIAQAARLCASDKLNVQWHWHKRVVGACFDAEWFGREV